MPRVSRSPQRDRGGGGRDSDTVDQSSLDQGCCRQTRRCGRQMETPSSSASSSRHQEERRSVGRCHVRSHRERRDDLRERARREAILEEASENDKPSTRSRVCRWANIAMGVVIALGLVFVFYVITTIIIDGSSPLDSLFGHKETVDPNLRSLNSSTNGTLVLVEEIQTKSTVEPIEIVTFSTNNFTSTIFSVSTRPDKELENIGKNNTKFTKIISSSNVEGRSFTDIPEDEKVDEYYYDDHDDNGESKPSSKRPNNKDDTDWGESVMDTLLNHEMILNSNHQMPDRKNSLSAQIIVNRKGLPPLHRSDGSHSIQHNLERSADLKYDPLTTYARSDQPNPRRLDGSRRNVFLTDYSDNSEDESFNYNVNRRRNGNRPIPYIHSPRNAYSDIERYKIHRNQDDNVGLRGRDYVARHHDREYDSQPRDRSHESRNRDRESIPYQRQNFQRSEFPSPSVSMRYKIRSREPYHSGSFHSPDTDPSPRKEFNYGRSLSTPSSTSDTKLRKLTEQEKSQILEMARLKHHEQLSRSVESDRPSFKSHPTPTEYKYPSSATSIRDIIDYMNYRDGKYDSKLRKFSDSEEIFQDVRTSSGFVIGDQDHVIGNNVFKSYNKFAVDNQNYKNPIDDNLSVIHHSSKKNFNVDPNINDMQGSRNPIHNYNNYYKHSNKNTDFYANNNDRRLPLEDAYPSRPRPEQDDDLYSTGTSLPNFNKVYPTVGDPFVGSSSSSSRSNTNPVSLILDIYPSEDISDPDAELKTELSLSDEFRNEYEKMLNVGDSSFRSSEHDQNKNEIFLHVNLYSKPIRPTQPFRSSNRQEDVSLEFPLNGRLSPLDIYRAIVSQKRNSPIASAQTGNYSEHMTEQSSVDSSLDVLDAEGKSKLFAAIEKGFKDLEPYRPGSSKKTTADIINPPGIKKERQY